jgi:Subtilisin inhibitor-like
MVVAMLLVAVLAGCSTTTAADTSSVPTRLTIQAWPNGLGKPPVRRWTLVCPSAGTLPRPEQACRALLALRAPFAPLSRRAVCTQIYGGPAEARVHGLFRGRRVTAAFSRGNGCRIAQWNRVAFLFPGVAHG